MGDEKPEDKDNFDVGPLSVLQKCVKDVMNCKRFALVVFLFVLPTFDWTIATSKKPFTYNPKLETSDTPAMEIMLGSLIFALSRFWELTTLKWTVECKA